MSKVRDRRPAARDTDGMAESVAALLRVSSSGQDEENQRPEFALTMYSRALELSPQQIDLKERINELKSKGVGKPLPD